MNTKEFPEATACPFLVGRAGEVTGQGYFSPYCLAEERWVSDLGVRVDNTCMGRDIHRFDRFIVQYVGCPSYTRGLIGIKGGEVAELLDEFRKDGKQRLINLREMLLRSLKQITR